MAPTSRRLLWLAPAAALVAHATYVANGFTWLDHGDVESGRAVLPLARLPEAFVTRMGDTGFFRPMVVVMHSLSTALFGTWAPGHHLLSVVLFALLVAAVPAFLRVFFRLGPREAVLAGLVVALHPLSALAVGSLACQQELLVTLFTLLAVTFHVHARRTGEGRSIALAVACAFLAATSKETAFFWLPALVCFWEIYVRPHEATTDARGAKRARALWGLESAALVGVLLLRAHAVPEIWRATSVALGPSEWAGTRLAVFGRSLVELVVPLLPSISDVTPIVPVVAWPALLVVGLALAAGAVAWRCGLGSPLGRAVGLITIALFPALRLVPVPRFGSPHYVLPATIGLAALLLLMQRAMARHPGWRSIGKPLVTTWLVACLVSTFLGGFRFRDDRALFEPELARDPDYPEGHAELGRYWLSIGELPRASADLAAALKSHDGVIAYLDASMTRVNLALACLPQGRYAEAEGLLLDARRGAPPSRLPLIDYNRALLAAQQGRDAAVVDILSPYGASWPTHEPYLLLARSLARVGRIGESRETLERAVIVAPADQRAGLESLLRSSRMAQSN